MIARRNKTAFTIEPGKQELFITREFDASRELVFKAFVEPELYIQWLGPRGFETRLDTFEPRSGGRWSYIQKDKDGQEYGFHGVNHDVTAPERLIGTFEYEGLPEPGHVSLETMIFESLPGNRTRITSHSIFQSVSDRDGMVESGMEQGVREGYERLDELLEKLHK